MLRICTEYISCLDNDMMNILFSIAFKHTDYASFRGATCLIKSINQQKLQKQRWRWLSFPARKGKVRLILLTVYHTTGSYLSLNQGRFPMVHVKESELQPQRQIFPYCWERICIVSIYIYIAVCVDLQSLPSWIVHVYDKRDFTVPNLDQQDKVLIINISIYYV